MISFTSIETKFSLKNRLKIRNWIKLMVSQEGKSVGDITFVFCNDKYLGSLNEKFLKHTTLTDIITFDYTEDTKLAGDICISLDRVNENAGIFNKTFENELGRVMAHGVLHLAGYKDKMDIEKKLMRSKEDFYLGFYPNC